MPETLPPPAEGVLPAPAGEGTPPPANFRCARCGFEGAPPGPPAETVFRCEDCGTCYAFGVEMARVTNSPLAEDRRFVAVKLEHAGAGGYAEFRFEREYARGVALDLLSVADPLVFQAFQALASVVLGDRNSSSESGEGAVATLDEPNL